MYVSIQFLKQKMTLSLSLYSYMYVYLYTYFRANIYTYSSTDAQIYISTYIGALCRRPWLESSAGKLFALFVIRKNSKK